MFLICFRDCSKVQCLISYNIFVWTVLDFMLHGQRAADFQKKGFKTDVFVFLKLKFLLALKTDEEVTSTLNGERLEHHQVS